MTIIPKSRSRKVTGLSPQQEQGIRDFLQGAVYCWCKNRRGDCFSMRDLMGGENFFWEGTPLMALFEKHKLKGKSDKKAIKGAGQDAGWLLKKIIIDDNRRFGTSRKELIRKYKWVEAVHNSNEPESINVNLADC